MQLLDLLDLTSYDEVRAVLGVSDEELSDTTLALPIYLQKLQMDLESVHPDLEDLYASTAALPESIRTFQQQKLFNVVQVYAAHASARTLLTSAALFAPKNITDGRAGVERFQDPFALLRDDIDNALIALRVRLKNLLVAAGLTFPLVTGRAYFGAAPLSVNPVTNA
jgi:hypothetical protein